MQIQSLIFPASFVISNKGSRNTQSNFPHQYRDLQNK